MTGAGLEVRGHKHRNGAARLQLGDFFAVPVAVGDADENPTERPLSQKGVDRRPAIVVGPKGGDQELRHLVFGAECSKGVIDPVLLRLTEWLDHAWSSRLAFHSP